MPTKAKESPRDRWPSIWRRPGVPTTALTLLCAILIVPGVIRLPATDRDEARFAQATRQMLESGDYVTIRFQDELRAKKPPGTHWLQAAAVSALRAVEANNIATYRIPSAISAWLSVLVTWIGGSRLVGRRGGFLAAVFMACSLLLNAEANLATADAPLLFLTTSAMICLGLVSRQALLQVRTPLWIAILFWTVTGLGMLIKGPVTPAIVTCCAFGLFVQSAWQTISGHNRAFWRRQITIFGRLRVWLGLPIVAAIVAPWTLAVQKATDGVFLQKAWNEDLWAKLLGGEESHGFPPGFHVLLLPLLFWPASMWGAWAIREGWRRRMYPTEGFLLAWLVPAWIVFEMVPTKLPHYVLPLYPALALLTGRAISRSLCRGSARPSGARIGFWLWGAISTAMVSALVGGLRWLGLTGIDLTAMAGVGIVAIGLTWWGVRAALITQTMQAVTALTLAAVLLLPFTKGVGLPGAGGLWPTVSLQNAIGTKRLGEEKPVAFVGFHEPSAVLAFGTGTLLLTPQRAAESLAQRVCSRVVVEGRQQDAFVHAAEAMDLQIEKTEEVMGWNVSKGHSVRLGIWRIREQ